MQLTKLLARLGLAAVLLSTLNSQLSTAHAQGTAFTYQGVLSQSGAAVNGSNDLTFTLYTAVSGGSPVGTSNVVSDLRMTNGLFTVTLDFGASPFNGSDRWLQIAARPGASTGAYTNLVPRQPITATPYATFAALAGGVNSAGIIGQITGSQLGFGAVGTAQLAAGSQFNGTFTGNGLNLTALNASQLTSGAVPAAALSNVWKISGNAGTTPGTHFLGTTDNQPLEFKVNNQRGLRLEYANDGGNIGVNVIGGSSGNFVASGAVGATIAGGGNSVSGGTNKVLADFGTVGGGNGNSADGVNATVGGGINNIATGIGSTIGGGANNATTGFNAAIPGGANNTAFNYAFAAGRRAKANHQGAFVWGDSTDADFASTTNNQFLIRASGGVGLGTTNPLMSLDVRDAGGPGGSIHVGDASLTVANRMIHFGDQDLNGHSYVAIGEGDVDDRLLLFGGSVVFTNLTGSSGNVGIGVNDPATKLHVNGTVTATSFSSDGSSPLRLETTNRQPLALNVNNLGGLRLEYGTGFGFGSGAGVNVIGGYSGNYIPTNAFGSTVFGGGLYLTTFTNQALASFATVSGGGLNTAGGNYSTVSGGSLNTASGDYATIPGGTKNVATEYAFAAGRRAKANHQGAFVWADSANADFASTADNQFLIRASGGVGIGTTIPAWPLDVNGSMHVGNIAPDGTPKLIRFGDASFVSIGEDVEDDRMQLTARAFVFTNLNGSGNVGIGRAPVSNKLEVEGTASKTVAGSWLANSDARIKKDIQPVTGALDKLSQIRLVSFRYTDDYRQAHASVEDRPYLNVVAQEFREVFPEHVKSSGEKLADGSDILQVDTYPLTIYSAAAVQELNGAVKALKGEMKRRDTQNAKLQEQNQSLEQRVAALEKFINRLSTAKGGE